MGKKEELFEKLNEEMAFYDPHKWLLDIEIEDIPEVIEELKEEIENLLQSMQDYDGDINLHDEYVDQTIKTIDYKVECTQILIQRMEEN